MVRWDLEEEGEEVVHPLTCDGDWTQLSFPSELKVMDVTKGWWKLPRRRARVME